MLSDRQKGKAFDSECDVNNQRLQAVQTMRNLVEMLNGVKVGERDLGDSGELGREDIMPGEIFERRDRGELPVGVPVH